MADHGRRPALSELMRIELIRAVLNLPRRIEPLGGQQTSYVQIDNVLAILEAALPASSEGAHARACVCMTPDPVMQADGRFYCYTCSFQTGARPRCLEPEDMARRIAAEGVHGWQETRLKIAGLVNTYHNDGTGVSAEATLRAIADALGPALETPKAALLTPSTPEDH
jgi:hypothetical protein